MDVAYIYIREKVDALQLQYETLQRSVIIENVHHLDQLIFSPCSVLMYRQLLSLATARTSTYWQHSNMLARVSMLMYCVAKEHAAMQYTIQNTTVNS